MLLAAGIQDFFEADAGGVVVKEWKAAITAEGDDVEMALVLVSLTTQQAKTLFGSPAWGGAACVMVEAMPGMSG